MIVLSAFFRAKPGGETELENILQGMIPTVQGESGTLTYALHFSREQAGHFFFFERYADQAALEAHMATPALAALLEKIDPLLAEAPRVETFNEIATIAR